ncbi:MAG: hypothetical protein ACTSQA_00965 [Candidatus Heimdallarchaeaceae archaeon]
MEKEYSWVSYIKQRIEKNLNMIIMISGKTGSGKSFSSLSIGEMLDPDFGIERVIFKAKDLMNLINRGNLKKGSVIIWEEAGIDLSSKSWQSTTNKIINFLIQSFRHRNFILIMNAPYSDFVDNTTRKLFHAEFQTVSTNLAKKKVTIKPKLLQYNASLKKWYFHYLKVRIPDVGVIKVRRWAVPKPSSELIISYEKAKISYTTALNLEIEEKLGGLDSVAKRKALTEVQERILEFWKRGEFVQERIAEKIGMDSAQLCRNVKYMRNKGYLKERYRKLLVTDVNLQQNQLRSLNL